MRNDDPPREMLRGYTRPASDGRKSRHIGTHRARRVVTDDVASGTKVCRQLDAARDWMFLLGRNNAQEKVAAFILHIWRRKSAADGDARCAMHQQQIDLPLSRSETAEYLGLRIETVSRQLQALRTAGIIETPHGRTMKVRDVRALERIVG
jgi:Crp-like helix-turn-helix domain